MNGSSWILLAGALVSATVAILDGGHLAVTVPAGAVAVLLVSIVGAVELKARYLGSDSHPAGLGRPGIPNRMESDPLLRLRRAFRTGDMGRSTILATIHALERDLEPTGLTPLSVEEERAALGLSAEKFRTWVDERLQRIEASS